ncbi:TFIIA-alpha and beta-like factor [Nematolebias whitei]|uniref:TFIIA-alpha and beta-like factor n=1 Tax=Nematolebias whitei TaxID=451745 RepID=UPI0018982B81|nr:TFIIA-alpha and beta-like factor [Nematolebias whitei]
MLANSSPVAKLYLSIIDDVIENMKELFQDEGLEDRVLDGLRQLWESKLMQSKAMEDFRNNNTNSSNFTLQLPPNYKRIDQEATASVVIPTSQNNNSSLSSKNSADALATFSLPASLAYPVQIPAGVTLQTASGQLYKVNVPVVVTQAPGGQQPAPHPTCRAAEQRASASQPAAAPPESSLPASCLPLRQESSFFQCPYGPEAPLGDNEPTPQPEHVNIDATASPVTQLLNFQISAVEALTQTAQSKDIDEILKEVIEEERVKAGRARTLSAGNTHHQAGAELDLGYSYSELSDIVQLDGPADDSDPEEEVPLEENDFLGLINAEAIKTLQEENGSSDGLSLSSSSDEGPDDLADVQEEDPLNSGDDVVEQDTPDLFDTENVIVCQYDKIHRSKNRWKFHLKDGVMCYSGRDYVFSKAVGEAEW